MCVCVCLCVCVCVCVCAFARARARLLADGACVNMYAPHPHTWAVNIDIFA